MTDAQVQTAGVQALIASAPEVQITTAGVELLIHSAPDIQITTAGVQVLIASAPPIQATTAGVEVLIGLHPPLQVHTAGVEVLIGPCVPAVNDYIADSIVLPGNSGSTTGTTVCASTEVGEPSINGDDHGDSVWYTWTATEPGVLSMTVDGVDTRSIEIFTDGPVLADLDGPWAAYSVGGTLPLDLGVTPQTYWIRVQSTGVSDPGPFELTWSFVRTVPTTVVARGYLGCGTHEAVVFARGGYPRIGQITGASAVSYDRRLSDTSEAVVTLSVTGGIDEACCDLLGRVEPWAHELQIIRDGEPVWEGPIVKLEDAGESIRLTARDLSAWLDYRVVREDIDMEDELLTIAQALIEHALVIDNPNITTDYRTPSGIVAERFYDPTKGKVGEHLRELVRTGLSFTTLGRRLVVGLDIPATPLGVITDEHLVGQPVIVKDGLQAATKWWVVGVDDTTWGSAETVHAAYGVVEQWAREQAIEDDLSCEDNARNRLRHTFPVPRLVGFGGDAQLAPHAPVTMAELVPGAHIGLAVTGSCSSVQTRMLVQGVKVVEDDNGERVSLALAPIPTEIT